MNNALNSFLQSEISNIAGKALDISLGMETVDNAEDGGKRTDYNFQFAKRFWNNRFRIVIGGKVSTGNTAQQDETFIDNVSIEYRLDNSGTRYVKVFHDKNYESGTGNTRTDYNFQFAKRFWNNRFQVIIGGKISTGNDVQQQDESFIDNISLEYRLDNSGTRYIKIFHDKNYESILDGEVIETGAGIVLRKKVSKLGELFIFRSRKKKQPEQETAN